MANDRDHREPPFEGGSQPVPEHPSEVPSGGRSVMQIVVLVISALVVLAVLLWVFVPFAAE